VKSTRGSLTVAVEEDVRVIAEGTALSHRSGTVGHSAAAQARAAQAQE